MTDELKPCRSDEPNQCRECEHWEHEDNDDFGWCPEELENTFPYQTCGVFLRIGRAKGDENNRAK